MEGEYSFQPYNEVGFPISQTSEGLFYRNEDEIPGEQFYYPVVRTEEDAEIHGENYTEFGGEAQYDVVPFNFNNLQAYDSEPGEGEAETRVRDLTQSLTDLWSSPIEFEGQAREIAEYIIQQLEQDLALVNEQSLIRKSSLAEDRVKKRQLLQLEEAHIKARERGPLEIFYDDNYKDSQTEFNNWFKVAQAPTAEKFTQTKEFAFFSMTRGRDIFFKLYPRSTLLVKPSDDPVKPGNPPPEEPLRTPSLQQILESSQEPEPLPVGPKSEISEKIKLRKLLPPLPKEANVAQSYCTGSTFVGKTKDNLFYRGKLTYPMGTEYESEFKDGYLHTNKHLGTLRFPRGDIFEGTWSKGHYKDGKITFYDGLEYDPLCWSYCSGDDRRFHMEKVMGLQGVGETFHNNFLPPPNVPIGCFDVGDGIYDPKTRSLSTYSGVFLRRLLVYRKAQEFEHYCILRNFWQHKHQLEVECNTEKFAQTRPPDLYASTVPRDIYK